MAGLVKQAFSADGTVCDGCSKTIREQALTVHGVHGAHFDYSSGTGWVSFDPDKTDIDTILSKIEEKNYTCYILKEGGSPLGSVFTILGVLVAAYFAFGFFESVQLPQISPESGLALIFAVGLLTGFHCVAMCGGFVVSYTAKAAQAGGGQGRSHLLYGAGKLISYTLIGAAFGLLGSVIAFTPQLRGAAGILAGLFLILFGLKMLNIFPVLRKLTLRTPAFLSKVAGKQTGPFGVGLANGLMIACGPLQAMYVLAAGTGSAVEGAKMLFAFGLGTLPVMIGFGYFASYLSSKATQNLLKLSGALVIVLGVLMLNNGLSLAGLVAVATTAPSVQANSSSNFQEIRMDVTARGFEPNSFTLKQGVPVHWIVNGKQITGCNKAIQVPSLGLKFDVKPGPQTIEFTPTEAGTISWSCWMGMLHGKFEVVP